MMALDQAAGLRRESPAPVRVLAVTSGKGGVGKTSVSINLAAAFGERGQRVLLLDADFGLANVDVMLGLQPSRNLSHVLRGECDLADVLVPAGPGVHVVPAASGIQHMAQLSMPEQAGIIRAFSELAMPIDVLLVDVAAGIAGSVLTLAAAAQEVLVVVCDEPASITDAYALIKVMSRDYDVHRFRIIANMVRSQLEGRRLYRKIAQVTDRFLDVCLTYQGGVPHDAYLKRALQQQRPVVDAYPSSPAAKAFRQLAVDAEGWTLPAGARGNLEFFAERLVGGAARPMETI
ncbi:MAG TPA: MinD/ParA family protein [Gammaproteobacteria bacterium]|nr:MinD/ParA family protein [Gammaproteobacteria bacterium]